MSYAAFGAGTSEGYRPPEEPPELPAYPSGEQCSDFIIRADGWCADTSGVFPLSWYDIAAGRCVPPPPISCDVNAPNLPDRCNAGEVLNSAVPTGCSPRGVPKGSKPKSITDQPGGGSEPMRASVAGWINDNKLAAAAIVGGALLVLSAVVQRRRP